MGFHRRVSWVATLLCSIAVTTLLIVPAAASASGTVTETFSTPGTFQFTVPAGVTSVTFDVAGAQGAANAAVPDATGGLGADVQGTLAFTGSETLTLTVAGQGGQPGFTGSPAPGGAGGFGGGGDGGGGVFGLGNGGGGASSVTDGSDSLIVAGGGGGASGGGGAAGAGGNSGAPGGAGTDPLDGGPGGAGGPDMRRERGRGRRRHLLFRRDPQRRTDGRRGRARGRRRRCRWRPRRQPRRWRWRWRLVRRRRRRQWNALPDARSRRTRRRRRGRVEPHRSERDRLDADRRRASRRRLDHDHVRRHGPPGRESGCAAGGQTPTAGTTAT